VNTSGGAAGPQSRFDAVARKKPLNQVWMRRQELYEFGRVLAQRLRRESGPGLPVITRVLSQKADCSFLHARPLLRQRAESEPGRLDVKKMCRRNLDN
jgi:hypothetical protein